MVLHLFYFMTFLRGLINYKDKRQYSTQIIQILKFKLDLIVIDKT